MLNCSYMIYGCLVDGSQVCTTAEQSCSHISVYVTGFAGINERLYVHGH
jgi:hypothetical protein